VTTLHGFDNTDGINPIAALVQGSDGNFYGTTEYGGAAGWGTVFKITPSGTFNMLYSFCPQGFPCAGGAAPGTPLVRATDGNFYGVTYWGGISNSSCPNGCGTFFKITPTGTLTTLHDFCSQQNCADGFGPDALMQASDGNFYGTTAAGGANNEGTVFKITSTGTLTTLYSFCAQSGCPDGSDPDGLMQASDGNFYGTAFGSGAYGYGAIFEITPSGAFTLLYSFNNSDGANPQGGLVEVNGTFYGTTYAGGANNDGTVFEFQVPPTLTVSTSGDGTVASTDGFIHCPGTCSHTYPANTPVTLNATPDQGWVFGGWDGACLGTSSCTVTMTLGHCVVAN
jgi:uncharacterized repeat protein (TIGR03803 family)